VAILLYCVTSAESAPVNITNGVCESEVQAFQVGRIRFYASTPIDPEVCLATPNLLRQAGLQFSQILREILLATTPIPFPFPALLESEEAAKSFISAREAQYYGELQRLSGTLQYELYASWEAEQQTDTSTPIKGSEYLRRRQTQDSRVAALDEKLRKVTGNSVREWRMRQDRKTHHWFALVEREQREKFLELLRGAGSSGSVRLRLRGPSPPEEFVQLST
jgi:hypothetical protein